MWFIYCVFNNYFTAFITKRCILFLIYIIRKYMIIWNAVKYMKLMYLLRKCLFAIKKCSRLTLILLTWKMWWANNARKLQMWFNSAFKGLMVVCVYMYVYIYIYIYKAVPLQGWSGPEGSRKLRFPDYMTTAQDGGKVVSLTHRPPLPPGNTPGTHFC